MTVHPAAAEIFKSELNGGQTKTQSSPEPLAWLKFPYSTVYYFTVHLRKTYRQLLKHDLLSDTQSGFMHVLFWRSNLLYLTCVDNVKPLQFLRVDPQYVYCMELQYVTHNLKLNPPPRSALGTLVPQLWVAEQSDTPQMSMGIGATLSLSVIILLIGLHSSHSL